ARDPEARAHFGEDEIARDLEQKIADEEDAGAETVHVARETERRVHLERGKTDVHPIEIRDEVHEGEKWDEAAPHASDGPRFERSVEHGRDQLTWEPRCSQPASKRRRRPPVRGCAEHASWFSL